MNIDVGVVRIAVVFVPGIVARMVSLRMRATKNRGIWEDLLDILVFAFVSYALAAILLVCVDAVGHSPNVAQSATAISRQSLPASPTRGILPENFSAVIENKAINWTELLVALAFSLVVGPAAAALENYKIVNKVGRFLRLTKTYGDDDVWNWLHNSSDFDWVYVRDYRKMITYRGHIRAFSDSYKPREIVLSDVNLYSLADGKEIDSLPAVYLAFPNNEVTIEIPQISGAIPKELAREDMERMASSPNLKLRKALLKTYVQNQEKTTFIRKKRVRPRRAVMIQAELNRVGIIIGKEGI
jgi:hypothetical protein